MAALVITLVSMVLNFVLPDDDGEPYADRSAPAPRPVLASLPAYRPGTPTGPGGGTDGLQDLLERESLSAAAERARRRARG